MMTMTIVPASRDAWEYLASGMAEEMTLDRVGAKAEYFMEGGTPPGVWAGKGTKDTGVTSGRRIRMDELRAIFGEAKNPRTGARLGKRFIVPESFEERVENAVEKLSAVEDEVDVEEVRRTVAEKEVAQSVSGFEMVFSPPKSVSSWWALADPRLKNQIRKAHHAAIRAAIEKLEDDVIRTRTGVAGVRQERVRGITAGLFDHWDSRDGDPQLHTHMLVSNRVATARDGQIRTIDSRYSLSPAITCVSVYYDTALMDELTKRFGVEWTTEVVQENPENYYRWLEDVGREDTTQAKHEYTLLVQGDNVTVKWQIAAVPSKLNHEFSSRARMIEAEKHRLIEQYRRDHGRDPGMKTVIKLRNQATLNTRKTKTHLPLKELTRGWISRARGIVGDAIRFSERLVQAQATAAWTHKAARADDITAEQVSQISDQVLNHLATARATWGIRHAETLALRQLMSTRFRTCADRDTVVSRVVEETLSRAIKLTPKRNIYTPAKYRINDDEINTEFTPEVRDLYTTKEVWDAEEHLLAGLDDTLAPQLSPGTVAAHITTPNSEGRILSADQQAAIEKIVFSGRRVDVLVGAAGAGKTTALEKLRTLWELEYGENSVIGLAPTAKAAAVLSESLNIQTENTAKWLYEGVEIIGAGSPAEGNRVEDVTSADETSEDNTAGDVSADSDVPSLAPGTLLIVDEASIAGTLALERLYQQVKEADAKLLLVGDWAQLSAVDAGGAFGMLVNKLTDAPELHELHRFVNDWEKQATQALRLGEPAIIKTYAAKGRIHWDVADPLMNQIVSAWWDDTQAGQSSLMIANTNVQAVLLSQKAQQLRIAAGEVSMRDSVQAADNVRVGVGDRIVTRKNARYLRSSAGRWVRNNDEWTVAATYPDGSVKALSSEGDSVYLPGKYVRGQVQLAYAVTAHRSQGRTVDTSHMLIDSQTSRESLYVGMSRGRAENHAWVDVPNPVEGGIIEHTWNEVITDALSRTAAELSAHETITAEHDRLHNIPQLLAERQTMIAEESIPRYEKLITAAGFRGNPDILGPVSALLRRIENNNVEITPKFIQTLMHDTADARDQLALMHYRLEEWIADNLTAEQLHKGLYGLIDDMPNELPEDIAAGVAARDTAIMERAAELVERAIISGEEWVKQIDAAQFETEAEWEYRLCQIACYREMWGVQSETPLGEKPNSKRLQKRQWEYLNSLSPRQQPQQHTLSPQLSPYQSSLAARQQI